MSADLSIIGVIRTRYYYTRTSTPNPKNAKIMTGTPKDISNTLPTVAEVDHKGKKRLPGSATLTDKQRKWENYLSGMRENYSLTSELSAPFGHLLVKLCVPEKFWTFCVSGHAGIEIQKRSVIPYNRQGWYWNLSGIILESFGGCPTIDMDNTGIFRRMPYNRQG